MTDDTPADAKMLKLIEELTTELAKALEREAALRLQVALIRATPGAPGGGEPMAFLFGIVAGIGLVGVLLVAGVL